ncbi:NAD(P)-dependent oxidoreductase [uncultured Amnibacterium sp.]|uniref:NAD(P)-dependent oxidoreductase n=1 Tax=uncultured Amnibacterium sp. TaxID=1631851 RepID=UPI0035C9C3B3
MADSDPEPVRVALLGTGTMGVGMAHSILRAGLPLTVWNRSAAKAQPLADDGATVADSAADAVREAAVVVLMLFDVDAVLAVLQDVADALPADAVVLQTSTIGPDGTARVAAFAHEHRITLVDAPVVGTKQPAEAGSLTVLVSGAEAAKHTAAPVLDAIGAKTVDLGTEPGSASALKLVANSWIATLTAGAAQAIELTRALGLPPERILQTISGGAADSPYLQAKGKAIIAGSFEPQFALDGLLKDLRLIHDAAAGVGVPTTLIDALLASFDTASQAGHGGEDIASVAASFQPA